MFWNRDAALGIGKRKQDMRYINFKNPQDLVINGKRLK